MSSCIFPKYDSINSSEFYFRMSMKLKIALFAITLVRYLDK